MAFASMFFIWLIIIIAFVICSTIAAIVLFIVSAVMKKKQNAQLGNMGMSGTGDYKVRKTYLVPRIIGFVCLVPLALTLGLIAYGVVSSLVYEKTSLAYNIGSGDFDRVEAILERGVTPDCTKDSNKPAENGEETMLYCLADSYLYQDQWRRDSGDGEDTHALTLEMMKLLIDHGADVNYAAYHHEKNYSDHFSQDEYSYYNCTDGCGWTPLMEATYRGDFEMIKLLVENGADVNAVDFCGWNVIHIAADNLDDQNGYEILNYFLEKGADPTAETNYGQDAYWLASRHFGDSTSFDNEKIRNKLGEIKGIDTPIYDEFK